MPEDTIPKEFIGNEPISVRLVGKDYQVSPITLGQIHRLKVFFRTLEPPQPVKVDVEGLVRAMYRPPADEETEDVLESVPKPLRAAELGKIRQDIAQMVKEMVREARGRVEQWPPDPTDPVGQELIFGDHRVHAKFIHLMLSKHHPEVTEEVARELAEEADVIEYTKLVNAAFRTIRDHNRKMTEELADDPKLQRILELQVAMQSLDSSSSGGDGAGSRILPAGK